MVAPSLETSKKHRKLKTAIVILNWNGAHHLKKFLPSVIEHSQSPNTAIYVADNGSTDDSLSLLKTDFQEVNLIELDKNYGFAEGYNQALKQIEADYFMILNSDVEVTPNWLDTMLIYMEANKDVAACQPKVLNYNKPQYFEHAGAAGGFIDYLGYPFCRGRIFAVCEEDKGQYDDIIDIFWATGACLLIRSEVFLKEGGFDGEFFAHMEEIDLCWRLRSRGYRIVCVPQSAIYHVGGGTLNVEHPRKTYLNFRNNLLMLYKNLPKKRLHFVMVKRFFMDYIAAIQLFITGNPKNSAVVFKARRDFFRMRSNFRAKREENLAKTTQKEIPEIINKSVVWGYYVGNKKRFSSLEI